jgi:RNA polymerase sigma factor (TIGR02999 family)
MADDVTELLARWNRGDRAALTELMPIVYGELRRLAGHYMNREQSDHTLQPTALVHEAYLRLAKSRNGGFNNRVHFYGAAAQAMRRILVDHARLRGADKRGRDAVVLNLADIDIAVDLDQDLVALDDALKRLTLIAPRPAQVVELRYFGGMTIEEVAELLDVAPVTVKRHWAFARAWLHRALNPT